MNPFFEALKIQIRFALALALLNFLVFIFSSNIAWAQAQGGSSLEGILINADSMSRDTRKKTVTLEGNVHVLFQGQYLSATKAIIYIDKKMIEAEGEVVLKNPKTHVEGDRVVFNYQTNTGRIFNGFVQSGQVVFQGKVIDKVGPEDYIASDAMYTACVTCPPAWSFTGSRIEAEMGGYAKISRPVLRLGGVPVLILPGLIVPLKSSRQSGFLVPSYDVSQLGGLAISQSFFWAISRSKDLTLTATHYEKRGLKGLAEYRYVTSNESRGIFRSAFLKDRAFGKEIDRPAPNRWFLDYRHAYLLPEDISHRVQLNRLSDLRYLRDFPTEMSGHGDPALENRVSFTKNTQRQHFSADASIYINLLQSDPLASNESAVHRIPELKYSIMDQRVLDSNLLFRMDANYVNFARDGFSYDDVNDSTKGDPACPPLPNGSIPEKCVKTVRDGQFNPDRDIMRTGQRLDIQPKLTYPISFGPYFTLTPTFLYRETQYQFPIEEGIDATENFAPSAARRYIENSYVLRTRFSSILKPSEDPKATRYRHEIEPSLTYSTIPWARRTRHGFFGDLDGLEFSKTFNPISDEDVFGRNKLQFDNNDRLFNQRILNLGLVNRWTRKIWQNGAPVYQNIITFRINQSYDFNEAATEKPQPWSAINTLLDVRYDNFETNTAVVHYPYANVTNSSSRVRVTADNGNFGQVAYTRSFLVDEQNVEVPNSKTENIGLGMGFTSKYLTMSGQLDYSNVNFRIQSWQYLASINPPGNCWNIDIIHQQVLGGDSRVNISFNFKFDGVTNTGFSQSN